MTPRVLLPSLLLVVAGCGATGPETLGASPAPTQERYEASAMVLESPEHGPELCLGGVAESLPPQCGGVPIANWDWAAVDGQESLNGTTWGTYAVVGAFDGETLTLTEPPTSPAPPAASAPVDPISTPCPMPEGGWQPSDPGLVSEQALSVAIELARAQPDHAGLWVDDQTTPPVDEQPPDSIVLNAAFTGDLALHERELRAVWGGPLCVVEQERTLAELRAIQDEMFVRVAAELGLEPTFGSVDETRGVVELGVVAVSPDQQAALDERYGAGVVEVTAGLQPRLVPGVGRAPG